MLSRRLPRLGESVEGLVHQVGQVGGSVVLDPGEDRGAGGGPVVLSGGILQWAPGVNSSARHCPLVESRRYLNGLPAFVLLDLVIAPALRPYSQVLPPFSNGIACSKSHRTAGLWQPI